MYVCPPVARALVPLVPHLKVRQEGISPDHSVFLTGEMLVVLGNSTQSPYSYRLGASQYNPYFSWAAPGL